jgi:hypothetical protein
MTGCPRRSRPRRRAEWLLEVGPTGKTHRVGPELASRPSSLTEIPYQSLRASPDSGSIPCGFQILGAERAQQPDVAAARWAAR